MGIAGENFVIVEGDAVGFAQQITAGVHELSADESVAVGGTQTGPDPYQLLLAAGRVYIYDRGDVRATKTVAARTGASATSPLEDLGTGLCRVRDYGGKTRSNRPGDQSRRKPHARSTPASH